MSFLKSNGKEIDTRPIRYLATEGEKNADVICIEINRYYSNVDLSACTFVMRGVNASGEIAEQVLKKRMENNVLILKWQITEAFTAIPGRLQLELRGMSDDTLIIKYRMQPITIHRSVDGAGKPSPDVAEQILSQMEQMLDAAQELTAKMPILQNGTWWLYNSDTGAYEDSGQPAQGAAGKDGQDGKDGADGAPGVDGKDGTPGKDGADGVPGTDGLDGSDGKSAYEIWLDAGNVGTEADFLASLKGDTGEIPDTSEILEAAQNAESIAKSVRNDLVNYYRKSETYTQEEVNQLISAIPKFAIAVVSTLPTSDISPATVYLLKSGSESGNLYTEYIYVGGSWETLGAQKMDLSGYYNSAQTDALLDDKVDKVDGMRLSANDFTDALLAKLSGIENGANKTVVDTALSESSANPVQNKAVAAALNTKSNTSHTHKSLAAATLTDENLNDIAMTTFNVYQAQKGHTCINAPIAYYSFTLVTTRIAVYAKSQIAVYPHNNTMYMRSLAASAWTDWTLINAVDTGWIDFTPSDVASQSSVRYRKIGNCVRLNGYAVVNTTQSSSTLIGKLPEGYRPLYPSYSSISHVTANGKYDCTTTVLTDGSVIIARDGVLNTAMQFAIDMSFLID